MQRIVMSRKVKVSAYEVQGTISFPENRSEVISILKMAEVQAAIDADDIVHPKTGLLPKRPLVMGRRLLTATEKLGLLSQNQNNPGMFSLTESGRQSLEHGKIFVPETSLWTIWTTEDPLLRGILHIERIVKKEGKGKVEKAPDFIKSIEGIVSLIRAHHTRSSEIEIKQIRKNVRKLKRSEKDLYLELSVEFGQPPALNLSGSIGTGDNSKVERRLSIPNEYSYDSIMLYLMSKAKFNEEDWDSNSLSLGISYQRLTDEQKKSHLKSIHIEAPELDGLGAFSNMSFQVTIHPINTKEAMSWAAWEFWDGWDETPWPDEADKRWEEISNRHDWKDLIGSEPPPLPNKILWIERGIQALGKTAANRENLKMITLSRLQTHQEEKSSRHEKHKLARNRALLLKYKAVQDIGGE